MVEKYQFTKTEELLLNSYFTGKLFVAITSAIISIVFAHILWDFINHSFLTIWSSTVVGLNLIRAYYVKSYEIKKNVYSYDHWLKRFIIPTSAVGVSWGVISFFIINKIPVYVDNIVVCFLLAMVIGAAVANMAHKKVSFIYTLSMIIPYSFKVLVEPSEMKIEFIIALILFTVLVLKMISIFSKFNEDNLKLISQREKLLADIQDKYQLEKELHNEKLKNLQNSKLISLGEITGGIAHEINNPLTIIVGKLYQLKRKIQKDEPKEDLVKEVEALNIVALRIGNIVKVMRELSRKDEKVELQVLCIKEMVNKALSNIEEKLLENPIDIIINMDSFNILGIEEHIIQTMSNLVSNSIDEIKESNNPWINIEVFCEAESIKVFFMDSGPGIDEQLHEKLFEPFFTTKDIGVGSGLGLSISKSLMNRIEGDLYYQLHKGHTNFVVELKKA